MIGVLCTVFVINHDLGHGIVSGKYFWFYASMALLTIVAVPVVIIKRKDRFRFVLSDLFLLLFCFAAVGITLIHTGRLPTKCLLLVFLMLLYFYLRIFLSGKSGLLRYLFVVFFILTGLVEAVWGLRQLYGFTASQHNIFKITGSFFNPGPYSGWLAMVFPMAFSFILPWNADVIASLSRNPLCNVKHSLYGFSSKGLRVLRGWRVTLIMTGVITCIAILLVLPATMSRASWLAALGGCAVVAFCHSVSSQNKLRVIFRRWRVKPAMKVIIVCVAALLLSAALTGLFLLKKDSASGRAFTWKIAIQTIKEHPMGVGLGNFAGKYGDVQAEYFASGVGAEREEYVAGGVEYAFNEYLQICIENGIIPFLVFLALVCYTLFFGIKNKNYFPVGSLVSLLIFASMSYPFNILPFVIAFVFLSALCVTNTNDTDHNEGINPLVKFAVWGFIFIAPMIIASSAYKIYPSYETYKQWKYTQMLSGTGLHKDASREYAKQYPYLQDDIQFLLAYIENLSKTEQYKKNHDVLQRTIYLLRSLGIPVTTDHTPLWGSSPHSWNSLVSNDGKHYPFMGFEKTTEKWFMHAHPPKVFRTTHSIQKESLWARHQQEPIPEGFLSQPNIKDVSSEYFPNNTYRYVRYLGGEDSQGNVAEIEFYTKAGNSFRKLSEKIIGTEGSWDNIAGEMKEAAFDGDVLSYFDGPRGMNFGVWVGLDLGKRERIDRIRFLPRNDDNNIHPCDIYELFFWDKGKWQSLGTQVAEDITLIYDDCPKGALLLLHNYTRGKEERIFTYENGKQVWW
jgi:O-antigen ligase